MNKVLKHSINTQEKINLDLIHNTSQKLRNIIPKIQQNEAVMKLQNLFKNFKSRKKLENLEQRNENLNNIYK